MKRACREHRKFGEREPAPAGLQLECTEIAGVELQFLQEIKRLQVRRRRSKETASETTHWSRTYLINKRECERTSWAAVQGAAMRRLVIPNKQAATPQCGPSTALRGGERALAQEGAQRQAVAQRSFPKGCPPKRASALSRTLGI